MGPMSVRSRRRWRINSWPAAKGISGSSAQPSATLAPSGTKRSIASAMESNFSGIEAASMRDARARELMRESWPWQPLLDHADRLEANSP